MNPDAVHPTLAAVTDEVVARSRLLRERQLHRSEDRRRTTDPAAGAPGPVAVAVVPGSGGLAHPGANADVDTVREALGAAGAVAEPCGRVPVACGFTRSSCSPELPLLDRDAVALATSAALARDLPDGALLLGTCDAVLPALLLGAAGLRHLPAVLVPAAPGSGDPVLPLLLEALGVQLPGAATAAGGSPLRAALVAAAAARLAEMARPGADGTPLGAVLDERAVLNGVVAVLSAGGSTRHVLYLVAVAAAAGVDLRWQDVDALSAVVPQLVRRDPGDPDALRAPGATAFVIRELLDAGLLHEQVTTVAGPDLRRYTTAPELVDGRLRWVPVDAAPASVRPRHRAFAEDSGFRLLCGNLGRALVEVADLPPAARVVQAPARVFTDVLDLGLALRTGELDRDAVVVLRGHGPRATGLRPAAVRAAELARIAAAGHRIALVTDGRLAEPVPGVAIVTQLTPEAVEGGPLDRVRNGDEIVVDTRAGTLEALVAPEELAARRPASGVVPAPRGAVTGLRGGVAPVASGVTLLGAAG